MKKHQTFKIGVCLFTIAFQLSGAEIPASIQPPNPFSQPVTYLKYYPPHFYAGLQKAVELKLNAPLWIAGATLIPTAFLFDESIRHYAVEKGFYPDRISRIGDLCGKRWNYFVAAGLIGLNGLVRWQPMNKTVSQIELLATIALTTGAATSVIKIIAHRQRPNGSSYMSFPSGHSSGSFALATGLNEIYGRKVGIPAYLMAFFIASSRINDNKHYFSDVVAGAFLGTWIGRSFARQYHLEWQITTGEPPTLSITIPL